MLQSSTFLATIKYFFDRGIRYITLAHGLSNHISDSSYQAEHGPYPFVSIEDVLDHFDHVIDLVGIDHVGIGSDFDGVGDSLPTGLKDVSDYPNLIEGLLRRGYSEEKIAKDCPYCSCHLRSRLSAGG